MSDSHLFGPKPSLSPAACAGLAVQGLMRSYVVVVDSLAVKDRCVRVLEVAHDFVSLLECAMIAFHAVIVQPTLQTHLRHEPRQRTHVSRLDRRNLDRQSAKL
jgi:hypothetical protein